MSVRDLISWGRSGEQPPAPHRDGEQNPFLTLHRQVNRLFDDIFRDFDMPVPFAGFPAISANWPNVEISDTQKELRVMAEVPGLGEDDVEVLLEDGALILRGEKKSEVDDKERQFSERFYGRFERCVPVGHEIQEEKVSATFKNGVLTVTLPKNANAQTKAKRIAINSMH